MPITEFTGFYTSKPFWAGSNIKRSELNDRSLFSKKMAEEVISHNTTNYTIKIARDGRVMLHINALEKPLRIAEPSSRSEKDIVTAWGSYLAYLNTFYLLLDSATIELQNFNYFNLHEITPRDAFRVGYEDGNIIFETIAIESLASTFQTKRYPSIHDNTPNTQDWNIQNRHVIDIKTIDHAITAFTQVVSTTGLEKTLSSFAKSLSEFKSGNYQTSIVLSWFIIESSINTIWISHIESLNIDLPQGAKRINRERKDFLTGREFTLSRISNLLELWGSLSYEQFQKIDEVRRYRNKIVHDHKFTPEIEDALLAINTAKEMITRISSIEFTPNTSFTIGPL